MLNLLANLLNLFNWTSLNNCCMYNQSAEETSECLLIFTSYTYNYSGIQQTATRIFLSLIFSLSVIESFKLIDRFNSSNYMNLSKMNNEHIFWLRSALMNGFPLFFWVAFIELGSGEYSLSIIQLDDVVNPLVQFFTTLPSTQFNRIQ